MNITRKIEIANEEMDAINVLADMNCTGIDCDECPVCHDGLCVKIVLQSIRDRYDEEWRKEHDY